MKTIRYRGHWLVIGAFGLGALGLLFGYRTGAFAIRIEIVSGNVPALLGQISGTSSGTNPSDVSLGKSVEFALGCLENESREDSVLIHASAQSDATVIEARGSDRSDLCRAANRYAAQVRTILQNTIHERCREAVQLETQRMEVLDERVRETANQIVVFRQKTPDIKFSTDGHASASLWSRAENKALGISNELAVCDAQIRALQEELARFSPSLAAAREALAQALVRYTEENAKVKELRAAMALLESDALRQATNGHAQISLGTNPILAPLLSRLADLRGQRNTLVAQLEAANLHGSHLDAVPAAQTEFIRLDSAFEALRQQRFDVARRQESLLSLASAIDTSVRIAKPALVRDVSATPKVVNGLKNAAIGAVIGVLSSLVLALFVPRASRPIRSRSELVAVTGVPMVGTLKDLRQMTVQQQERWGFETFTTLRAKLADPCSDTFVCAFTSSHPGEGRSTWIDLLQKAAADQGYRVITIFAGSPAHALQVSSSPLGSSALTQSSENTTVEQSLITQSSIPTRAAPTYSIWGSNGRARWRELVNEWTSTPQLVVLAELPPASTPEGVLLAERFPNLIWLCGTGITEETMSQIELLRNVRANLVGCALNYMPTRRRRSSLVQRASMACFVALILASAQSESGAQTTAAPTAPVALSFAAPDRLGEWQKKLTLGPSDVFDIALHDEPDTARPGMVVGPDGRINYLEARDVMAAGATIDELRATLENILSKYHRGPRVVINPVVYSSKKYFVLGNVNQKGTFVLDRPTSIVEAIAKARGFTTALENRNSIIQADFARSFLMRQISAENFKRVGVDFEGLFLRGDLSQNVALEPGDYLFFPPVDLQEAYVLGEVRTPGVTPYAKHLTALGAIVSRGGFTDKAWKNRVLIVRGSLQRPQTYILQVSDVLAAKSLDLVLSNRDIVYVHRKPWAKAEELVESAILNFTHAFVVGYVGQHVGPFITEPIVK